jgi:DNA-binding NtrC family response regulator
MVKRDECHEMTILLIDDDSGFRDGLASLLEDDGHEVLSYSSPSAVPANENLPPVHLLICDYDMPGENGFSFADRFHKARPQIPVIVVTAYRASGIASRAATRPFVNVLWKPFEYEEIHDLLHSKAGGGAASPPA